MCKIISKIYLHQVFQVKVPKDVPKETTLLVNANVCTRKLLDLHQFLNKLMK